MNSIPSALLFLLLFAAGPGIAAASENELPADAAEALRSGSAVVIYSLEPYEPEGEEGTGSDRLHGFQVLGRAALDSTNTRKAVAEFETAIADWDGAVAMCFDPRHALRTESGGHTFDFLLCYDCNELAVYRDGAQVASIGIAGSPRVLDEMMAGLGLALSKTGDDD